MSLSSETFQITLSAWRDQVNEAPELSSLLEAIRPLSAFAVANQRFASHPSTKRLTDGIKSLVNTFLDDMSKNQSDLERGLGLTSFGLGLIPDSILAHILSFVLTSRGHLGQFATTNSQWRSVAYSSNSLHLLRQPCVLFKCGIKQTLTQAMAGTIDLPSTRFTLSVGSASENCDYKISLARLHKFMDEEDYLTKLPPLLGRAAVLARVEDLATLFNQSTRDQICQVCSMLFCVVCSRDKVY